MRGRFPRELNNPFSEIGLYGSQPFGFERRIEMNLFSRHALRFDDMRGLVLAQQAKHDLTCLGCIVSPMNLRPGALGIAGEGFQVPIKVRKCFFFDDARAFAQSFPIINSRQRHFAPLAESAHQVAQCNAQLRVVQRPARVAVKSLRGKMIHILC